MTHKHKDVSIPFEFNSYDVSNLSYRTSIYSFFQQKIKNPGLDILQVYQLYSWFKFKRIISRFGCFFDGLSL